MRQIWHFELQEEWEGGCPLSSSNPRSPHSMGDVSFLLSGPDTNTVKCIMHRNVDETF